MFFLVNDILKWKKVESFSPLDPSDFPVLHRSANSPFQQQHLQQLQQQLRSNNSLGFGQNVGPNSAPILNSSSLQSFMLQLASSASGTSSNLAPSPASQMMMNSLNSNNNTCLQYNNSGNNMSQQTSLAFMSNQQSGSGKMWSNFGSSSKDSNFIWLSSPSQLKASCFFSPRLVKLNIHFIQFFYCRRNRAIWKGSWGSVEEFKPTPQDRLFNLFI